MNVVAQIKPSLDYEGKLSQILGPKFAGHYDILISDKATEFCKNYVDGSWDLVVFEDEDGKEGFYLRLDSANTFKVEIPEMYYTATVSAEAFSLILNLYAQNAITWVAYSELPDAQVGHYVDLYYRLREFAYSHPEAQQIIGATN